MRSAVKAAIAKIESAARPSGSRSGQDHADRAAAFLRRGSAGPRRARPTSRAGDLDRALQVLRERVSTIDGVLVLAPPDEPPSQVRSVLRARNLRGYYIESSVTSLERSPAAAFAPPVSVIVATYPDRAMRAIMQGAATAMGGGDSKTQAMAAALKSALNQLPQAMARE